MRPHPRGQPGLTRNLMTCLQLLREHGKEFATVLAPLMDKGMALAARFNSVTGGTFDKYNFGALLLW